MQPSVHAAVQARVQVFVDDITALVRKAALDALEKALQTERRRRQPPWRRRRSRAELEGAATQLLDHIKHHPGQRIDQIAKEMKVAATDLAAPMRILVHEASVRTRGTGRGAIYWTRLG